METDRIKWDQKYRLKSITPSPAALLHEFLPKLQKGLVLDLACGLGQNSRFLAERGFQVHAADVSPIGLAQFEHPAITKFCCDLDHGLPCAGPYDAVLNFFFLDRGLFPHIEAAMRPGGILLFQTFLSSSSHVRTPAYKLKPGELARAFPGLNTLYYREEEAAAALVAQKPEV